jgi:cobalt/nickel transport system permease protein
MHDLLDDYSHSNALRETSPRLKLLFGLGAILLCASSVTPTAPLFIAVTMSIINVIIAKLPGRFYSELSFIPFSFSLLSAVVVAFMHCGGDPLFAFNVLGLNLGIREGGANLALLLMPGSTVACALYSLSP